MNLDNIYSLRKSFSIIGLTGRTGAGCSKTASIFSKTFDQLDVRKPSDFQKHNDFTRKYRVVYNFAETNWQKYEIINYKDVVLLLTLPLGKSLILRELKFWYKNTFTEVVEHVDKWFNANSVLIGQIMDLGKVNKDLIDDERLDKLGDIYFNQNFHAIAKEFYDGLNEIDIYQRLIFSHRISNNLRGFGTAKSEAEKMEDNYIGADIKHVYTVAEAMNRLIKAKKRISSEVHIVIDGLKNSIEIMFFKERYSAFYMLAVNSNSHQTNIQKSIEKYAKGNVKYYIERIEDLDRHEYSDRDFKAGEFFAPDIQNCIQKSDIHLNTDTISSSELEIDSNRFRNIDEYLIKYASLIQHPGIVTPTAFERCMQVAYNAKYNSGCISRQVGAVVTDAGFSIKSVGWNDVPAGSVPCLQRDAFEYIAGPADIDAYSNFEKDTGNKNVNSELNFRSELDKLYSKADRSSLNGLPCPFCFKSVYNSVKAEENQVHTRSLHAEENAMLQISKNGGMALKGGHLFTTASPCELCSKKAYQLGISNIYYIDPYPGISQPHILATGKTEAQPTVNLFSGAVGRAYHKLYEPFMAYKDELAMITGVRPTVSLNKKVSELIKSKGFDLEVAERLQEKLKDVELDGKALSEILWKGLEKE